MSIDLVNSPPFEEEKQLSPDYLAGAADGILRSEVRPKQIIDQNFDFLGTGERLETSIIVDSRNKKTVAFWGDFFQSGTINKIGTTWSLTSYKACLELIRTNDLFQTLILRKEEFERLTNILVYIEKLRNDDLPRSIAQKHVKYYFDYYIQNRNRQTKLTDFGFITPKYLAGMFELSPKGSIWVEKSSNSLVVQIGTPHYSFAEALKQTLGGGISEAYSIRDGNQKKVCTYIWKLKGKRALQVYTEILEPNFQYGGVEVEEP